MKDMQVRLEKLRTDAAECALFRDLATDPKERELFAKLAEHLTVLASEVEGLLATAIPRSLLTFRRVLSHFDFRLGARGRPMRCDTIGFPFELGSCCRVGLSSQPEEDAMDW